MTNELDIYSQHFALVSEVMVNIRFPMMDSRQLASLLLSPLVMKFKDFFMERMAIGVAFHQGGDYFYIAKSSTFQIRSIINSISSSL